MTQTGTDALSTGDARPRFRPRVSIVLALGLAAVAFVAVFAASQRTSDLAPPLEVWTLGASPPLTSTPVDVRSSPDGAEIPGFEFRSGIGGMTEGRAPIRLGALRTLTASQWMWSRFATDSRRDEAIYDLAPSAGPEQTGTSPWQKWVRSDR